MSPKRKATRRPKRARRRKRGALEDLRLREAQLSLILEGVQDHAITQLDAQGRIVTWNAAAERIKGWRLEEVRGRHYSVFFTREDRRAGVPERELATAVADGKFLGGGWRVRKDGSRFYASVALSSLRDRSGRLRGFVKVSHDITEETRARAESESLGVLTARLAEAATTLDVARVLVEQGGRVLDARGGAVWTVEPSGLRLAAQAGAFPASLLREPSLAARVASSREPIFVARSRAHDEVAAAAPLLLGRRLSGVVAFAFERSRVFSPPDRTTLSAIAHHGAQSLDRARLLDSERRANDRLRVITEASALLAASLEYEEPLANLARFLVPTLGDWCAIDLLEDGPIPRTVAFAHVDPAKTALGRSLRDEHPVRADDRTGVMKVLRTGTPELHAEITEETLDLQSLAALRALGLRSAMIVPLSARGRTVGTLTLVSTTSERLYDTEDLAFATEVASRAALHVAAARLFREVRQSARRAEEASRMKDEFLATVSHELRTPLNAMLGWARMLRTGELGDEKEERALESIERNATAQAQLIEDLLDVSRIITGKLRLEVRPLDLGSIVGAAVDSLRPALEAKGIRFLQMLEPDASPILGDSTRLQQVVWNLVSNAVKFTPRGGRVQVLLRRVNSHVELCVVDSGQGIAPEFLPHVFERFLQADAGTTRAHGGLGLGLAICRSLVELHGGTIEVQSEGVGKGATFVVRLPRSPLRHSISDPTREHPTAPDSAPTFEAPAELAGLRVLVVDDEEDARDLIVTILDQCGAETRAVPSMGTALEAIRAWRPDVLLSDIGMPDGDGYDLIRSVRGLPAGEGGAIPAGALTAYARAEDRRRALVSGYQMHVPKPVEPAELAAVVANLARIGRALR